MKAKGSETRKYFRETVQGEREGEGKGSQSEGAKEKV